jgi:hypothetical protein
MSLNSAFFLATMRALTSRPLRRRARQRDAKQQCRCPDPVANVVDH